jgi:hypothetical protein
MNYLKKAARMIGSLLRTDRKRRPARPAQRPGGTRLGAEHLEARDVPAVFTIPGTGGTDTFEFDRTAPDRALVTVNGDVRFDGVVAPGDRFVLRGLGQIDDFNINSTPAGVTVEVNGNAGIDFIDIAPGSSDLDGIRGPVVVDGGGSTGDTLRLHDLFDDTDNTFEVSGTRVDRNNSAPVDYSGIEMLQVFGGTGTQVFNVAGTLAGVTTQLFGNQQGDRFNLTPVARNLGSIDGTLSSTAAAAATPSASWTWPVPTPRRTPSPGRP